MDVYWNIWSLLLLKLCEDRFYASYAWKITETKQKPKKPKYLGDEFSIFISFFALLVYYLSEVFKGYFESFWS